VRARLTLAVDNALDRQRCRDLLDDRALAHDSMDAARVRAVREEMERAEARRLQPHFIAAFFLEAFRLLGGTAHQREEKRWEITRVPSAVRHRDRQLGRGNPVLDRYERIAFEKSLISVPGQPLAAFVCPGHPLLDAALDLVLERYRDLFKHGTILVDPTDAGDDIRVLYYLEQAVTDARLDAQGQRRVISRQVHFLETDREGHVHSAGYAPHIDYEPLEEADRALVEKILADPWFKEDLEERAVAHAISELIPRHLREVRERREALVEKTKAAVKDRLLKEIAHWDHRAQELRAQEQAGRIPRLNSETARQRADDLHGRLRKRLDELEKERQISAQPPVVVGAALVVPSGLLKHLRGEPRQDVVATETARIESLAMEAVMAAERDLGFDPRDVSTDRCGYDIESRVADGRLRFIEVKGRHADGRTITVTRNEVLTALNKPEDFILAIVRVSGDDITEIAYVRRPFQREPDFGVTSVNYDLGELLARSGDPA